MARRSPMYVSSTMIYLGNDMNFEFLLRRDVRTIENLLSKGDGKLLGFVKRNERAAFLFKPNVLRGNINAVFDTCFPPVFFQNGMNHKKSTHTHLVPLPIAADRIDLQNWPVCARVNLPFATPIIIAKRIQQPSTFNEKTTLKRLTSCTKSLASISQKPYCIGCIRFQFQMT